MKHFFLFLLIFYFICFSSAAQYNPQEVFKTNDFYEHSPNLFRNAGGLPSIQYWQNQADYNIKADFDTKTNKLNGEVIIHYTNNSPDDLQVLWLQLDQNTTQSNSEYNQIQNPGKKLDDTQGYQINKLVVDYNSSQKELPFHIYGTRLEIPLKTPLKSGDYLNIKINYSFILQKSGGGFRSGYMDTENGKIYEVSYWYPRMCVYDDYYGWNTLPFIGGGEMYLDYGDIDYKLTVPADQLVVGSGVLINAEEILNKRTLKRLNKAKTSDKTLMVRKPNEIHKPVTKKKSGKVTWHFKMKNTRDVAWAMSEAFVWDAAKINLSNGKSAMAQSVYPIESTKKNRGWSRSTEMFKGSVEFFSNYLMDYPYKVATSVAGSVGGMEFPGLTFNHWDVQDDIMFLLASHEIGHTWFPMIVGSDERRNAFLDEGLNVFIDILAQENFNKGEFAPKRDGEYAPGGGNPNDEIVEIIKENQHGPTILTVSDNMDYQQVHPLQYFKAAHGLILLRDVILGHKRFDYAFKKYTENWAYKHPRPEDFFRAMDNFSGEDLTWFWNAWYAHNWLLDQAVKAVDYIDENPENGAKITLENKQKMVMPILIQIKEHNGKTHQLKIPVGIWKTGKTVQFKVKTTSSIKEIILDPNHKLPDSNRSNNTWTP